MRKLTMGAGGVLSLAVLATVVATAFAGSSLSIGSASNSSVGMRVAVNPQGRTLYWLSPETGRHLLCKSKECLKFWPPVTVSSTKTKLVDGSGVHGKLAILRRSNGLLQVTLRGMPLYRYSQDHARGETGGEGIESFGGTWHAVSASGSSVKQPAPAPPMTPTTPTTTPTSPSPPPYSYPSY